MSDGLLVEFNSVVDAVRCAVKVQNECYNTSTKRRPADGSSFGSRSPWATWSRMATSFTARVVDIASRMESLAQPGGVNVSCAVRDQVRDRLPIAFEDLGEHEVKNTARPVHSFRVVLDKPATPPPSPAPKKVAAPSEKAAVAVLPFQNLGGDAEAEFFLDSVAEDLITELARGRWFPVVARNTSFTYKGKGADAKQLARDFGVRYLVEGSLRKAGNCVRIACQLVEAASGQHLWAERFDGTLEDSFDLQDKIHRKRGRFGRSVLRGAEIERARRKPEAARISII